MKVTTDLSMTHIIVTNIKFMNKRQFHLKYNCIFDIRNTHYYSI